jgi:dihydrofolate reductase
MDVAHANPRPTRKSRSMPKVAVFNQVTLDGFFADAGGDMTWAHRQDEEWKAFAEQNAKSESRLLLGRVTYELMAAFWPTPSAATLAPVMAERMYRQPKVVFSRTLDRAAWTNTVLIKGNRVGEVRGLKGDPGPDMVILGSGSLVS